jgi:hypothetical protein
MEVGFNVLPHPGLLPKEKENRSPRLWKTSGGIGRRAFEQTENVTGEILSPGERTQVRAD